MKRCYTRIILPLRANADVRPLRLQISGAKIHQLLTAGVLHAEDLRCLDGRSHGVLRQLLLRCCLVAGGGRDEK